MSALAKMKHIPALFAQSKQQIAPYRGPANVGHAIQVNEAVRGNGPDRQGSGNADSGRGELSGGNGESLILVMAGTWRNSVFFSSGEISGEISVLTIRIL